MADKVMDDFDNQYFISFCFFSKLPQKNEELFASQNVLLSKYTEQSYFMNVKWYTDDACQIIGFQ